jgi:thioredoxin-dependent peroxiredoxin
MSKKTRNKTPKKTPKSTPKGTPNNTPRSTPKKPSRPSAAKASVARSKTPAKAAKSKTRSGIAKMRSGIARKSDKTAAKRPGNATAKASHKAPLKPLKPPAPTESAPQKALTEGAKAPAFRLPRDGGSTVSLADYAGGKLVLFFYPRADTPGCTKEAIEFTRLSGAFAENQTAVLGVSADPLRAQEAFRDKHGLAVPLLSDEPHKMLEAYGVWGEKSMYGRTFLGILRTTVLIGTDSRIIRIWRNVKVDGHADDVLAAVRSG